jgi:transposase
MEATGVYWKPVFYLLEQDMDCWLLNARHMRAVPGGKTDVKDCEWIAQRVEHALVRASRATPSHAELVVAESLATSEQKANRGMPGGRAAGASGAAVSG